jgi:amino acid transporter
MRSSQLSETLLPKKLAMPVFCSDPLSSVAYATEEILLILSLAGLAFLHLAWYVAAVIVALLAVVIVSYRQTCRAYPNGGGAYTVARANLGRPPARCWSTTCSRSRYPSSPESQQSRRRFQTYPSMPSPCRLASWC